MLPRGHHIRLQFLSTIFGNLINLAYGLTIGWSIVYTNRFSEDHSNPLGVPALNSIEIKWIESSFYIGGLIGTVFLTMNGDIFGRKYTLIVCIVPQGFGCFLKMIATNATEVYIGQFLSGFSAGGSINLMVLFVAELADDKFRGRISSILPLSVNVGMLMFFVSDIFLSFKDIAYVAFVVLFLYMCLYTFFPDTPRALYKIRRKEQAIESLQIYKDIRDLEVQTDDCYQIEVKKMRRALISESGCVIQNTGKATLKTLIISVALIILNVYVNWYILQNLTKHQLLDTTQLSVANFRIVIGACQLAGSLLCLILIDFIERKAILMTSIVIITAAQILFIIYESYLKDETYVPILISALTAFSLHFGVYPLTFVLIPEIIPEKIRIYGVTFLFSLMWMLMFGFSLCESTLADWLYHENYVAVIVLIVFNIICLFIFGILVPPTKKKSYGDIFSYLNFELEL